MKKVIEDLSNVFTTLGEIHVSGRESYAMFMCMKTIEKVIGEIALKENEVGDKGCQTE